ncbi:LuxR C-terminal-related transcriptional regulator [Achromobacter anxifer]|uniref:LuxR C-terminal-related transcriptional regulator n=1 Tax=Achromobacter anxifer TaxID=1287737 RepID=UPI0021588DDE|nr:LuxR C-terminal-related transcriptional regulator [Achromobacter anxifer]
MTANAAAPHPHRQHLQRIITGLNEGIILLESDGAIAWANASALRLHGTDTLDELGGTPSGYRKRYTLTYRNQHRVPARQYPLDRLAAAEPFDELLLDLERKDDEEFLRNVRASGLNLDGGDGADYRVLILHDQTEQINAEAHRSAEQALREIEERRAQAFRLAPVPMAVCEGDTLLALDLNDAYAAATGASAQDGIGRALTELGLQPYEGMEASLKRGESARNREVTLAARDGGQLDCLMSAEPVMIGGQQRVLLAIQDITERKRSETELLTAIEAVMQDTSWFSRSVIEKLAQLRAPAPATRDVAELAQLTSREREVLALMCQGHDDDGIAQNLKLSRNTVRNHVATIYSKIGVHRRSAAIVWARDRGITGHERARMRDKPPKG